MTKVEFVSQRGTKYSEYGCGLACLEMLLRFNGHSSNSLAKLGKELRIDKAPEKRLGKLFKGLGKGAYNRDVVHYLEEKDISYIHIESNSDSPSAVATLLTLIECSPTMVGMNDVSCPETWGDGGHWIVVEFRGGGRVRCVDPYSTLKQNPRYYLTEKEFLKDWDGTAISIT